MNYFKTALLMVGMTALLMFVGQLLMPQNPSTGLALGFIIALGMNGFQYWFSDKIVLKMYGARPIDAHQAPDVYRAMNELVHKSGMPMPKIYWMDNPTPNAFATGRNPQNAAIVVTSGILQLLSYEELKGVLAHELAHVKNRDILISTIASTFAQTIMFIVSIARWTALFGGFGGRDEDGRGVNPIALIVGLIVMPLAATLLQMAISRSREYAADATGATLAGSSWGLASALEKLERGAEVIPMHATEATANMFIVNPLRGSSLMNLFSTHPPTQERIRRLREMNIQ